MIAYKQQNWYESFSIFWHILSINHTKIGLVNFGITYNTLYSISKFITFS